jgi:hypothetical protein
LKDAFVKPHNWKVAVSPKYESIRRVIMEGVSVLSMAYDATATKGQINRIQNVKEQVLLFPHSSTSPKVESLVKWCELLK